MPARVQVPEPVFRPVNNSYPSLSMGRGSSSRTFQLTDEGRLFYERCERIAGDIAEAEAEVSSKGKIIKGKLRIGAPTEIGRRLIAPLAARFVEKFPGTQVISIYRTLASTLSMTDLT